MKSDVVDKKIAQRNRPISDFGSMRGKAASLEEAKSGMYGDILSLIGEGASRAGGAITGPILKGLQGRPEEAFNAFLSQVTQKNPMQYRLEDISRQVIPEKIAGFNTDPLSQGIGFVGEMLVPGAIANIATKGKIVNGIGNLKRGIEEIVKENERAKTIKNITKNNTFYYRAGLKVKRGIDQVSRRISKEYDDIFSSIGDTPISEDGISQINSVMSGLPERAISAVKRQLAPSLKKGDLAANVKNTKELKTILSKQVKPSVWKKIDPATNEDTIIMNAVDALDDISISHIGDPAERAIYEALKSKYRAFRTSKDAIYSKIVDSKGKIKTAPLTGIKGEGSEGFLRELASFGKSSAPMIVDVLGDINKHKQMQSIKSIIGKVATGAGLAGAAYFGTRAAGRISGGE
jgi:hypothetical protein